MAKPANRLCHLFFEPARDDHATHDHPQVYRVAGPGFGAAQLSQGTRLLSKLGGFLSKHLGARRRVGGGLPGDLILCSQSQICPPQSGRRFCLRFTAATSPTGRARPAANGAAFPRADRGRPRRGLPHTRPNRPRPLRSALTGSTQESTRPACSPYSALLSSGAGPVPWSTPAAFFPCRSAMTVARTRRTTTPANPTAGRDQIEE